MSLVTYNGIEFNYLNPTKEMINFDDIFRSLPRLNRFVGHSSRAYSVGEHSLLCLAMAEELGYSYREMLLTFVHDFTEAYVSDCPAPLKQLLPEFSVIEAKVEQAIYQAIEIEPPTEEEHLKVKRIDLTMLVVEMRDLTVHEWGNFLNDYTYDHMLDVLSVSKNPISEDVIKKDMKRVFFDLLKHVKEEEEENAKI